MSACADTHEDTYVPDVAALSRLAASVPAADPAAARAILESAGGGPLLHDEIAALLKGLLNHAHAPAVSAAICEASSEVRSRLFGNAVVPMAPVELSNTCASDCVFCGWRLSNRAMKRLRMPADLAMLQVEYLVDLGIHYIEFVSGDDVSVVRELIPDLVTRTRQLFERRGVTGKVSFCTLALTEGQYRDLRAAGADNMIVWQEAYDPEVYRRHVVGGPKAYGITDDWRVDKSGDGWRFRIGSQERAMRAGIEPGLGSMLGLNPDITTEFLATVDHARHLAQTYGATAEHPMLIGMPIWNHITTRETDLRPRRAPNLEKLFPALAGLYLLALPHEGTWVFPNCRVPMKTQVEAMRVAGAFSSTEVKLGPGGYLPGVIRRMQERGEDVAPLLSEIRGLLRDSGLELGELARALDEREQFVHHYHGHERYLQAIRAAGLEVVTGVRIPPPAAVGQRGSV